MTGLREAVKSVVRAALVGGALVVTMALSHHGQHAGEHPTVVDNGVGVHKTQPAEDDPDWNCATMSNRVCGDLR